MVKATEVFVREKPEQLKNLMLQQVSIDKKDRIQALYLLTTGRCQTITDLSQIIGKHETTIWRWLKLYSDQGLFSLLDIDARNVRACSFLTNSKQLQIHALRGATTANSNTCEAITSAVIELMETIEARNQLVIEKIVSVTFSVTRDLDAIFPAAIARQRHGWEDVPLLDVQHMYVKNSLRKCIRVLIHLNTPLPKSQLHHVYLSEAANLRPDLALSNNFV